MVLVGDSAVLPYLVMGTTLGRELAELDHGGGEVIVPLGGIVHVLGHVAPGFDVRAHNPVGLEKHPVLEVGVVVAVVQGALRRGVHPRSVVAGVVLELQAHVADVILLNGILRILAIFLGLDVCHKRLFVAVVDRRRGCIVEAILERREVGDADGVRAGEDDELLLGEVLLGEVVLELLELEGGLREDGVCGGGR